MNSIFKRENIKYFGIIFVFISIFFLHKSNDFDYSKLMNNTGNIFSEEILVNDVKGTTSITLVSGKDLIPNSKNAADMKNNTTKLQTAIDTISNSGGGYVYLPAGTFYFSQGGIANHGNEDYAIRCRNNVHLIGAGTNENNTSKLTVLKPYYYSPKASGGMDMFYFNNYTDTNYNVDGEVTPTTKKDISYTDMNGKKQILKDQTVYLINADFSNFIVDGDESRGGIAACGGTYLTDGKGFMINLFKDCDWNNIVVKNTDATGFGIDCPLNSTMTNCKAINCGKAAKTTDGGASGFGIGVGYSNNESLIITNCVALNNKKFGFFFEHQSRFGGSYYPATTSKKFVVSNSIAGGNMYDFGGLKAYDVIFENVKSISGQGAYTDSSFKKTTAVSTACDSYTKTTYTSNTSIKLATNVQPVFFSLYSTNVQMINSNISSNATDITSNTSEINWAINKGILYVPKGTTFSPKQTVNRFDALKTFMIYENYPGQVTTYKTGVDTSSNLEKINKIGFTDITTKYQDEYDVIVWAYNKGLISKDTKFNPANDCTRSAYITMLYRLAGSPNVSTTVPFTDVVTTSWYYKAVAWGYSVGIIKGSTSNTFDPDRAITKSEIAIFLYRYNNLQTNTNSITYALNEGSVSSNPTTYTPTSSKITLKNPTKSGYTFMGWTGSNGANPSKNVSIPTGTKGDLAYTANWKPNLSSISIKTTPTKLSYYVGENIISNGLTLNAYYTDSSIAEITGGYTLSPTTLSNAGTQKVTVTYQGKTATFNVTVTALQISSISIKTNPTKTTYFVGENLDTTGLVLNVKYSDGATKQITTGYTVSPTKLQTIGTQKITVTYQGKTTSFNVTVKNNDIKSISVKTNPTKTTYFVGDDLDTNGLVLTATYSDNSTKQITTGYTVSPTKLQTAGTQRITVTYQGKITTFNVTVKSNAVKQISIKKQPTKTTYFVGDNLDTTGLILLVTYENGTTKEISSGFTIDKNKLTTYPSERITISYQGKTTTFNVNVNKVEVLSISIKRLPNQTTYIEKDKFSSEGLVLSVNKSNGYTEEITNGFTLSISEGQELTGGVQKVIVTYQGKTTSFDITINKANQESIIISNRPNKINYIIGDKFSSKGLELEYIDKTGNKKAITSGYVLSIKDGTVLSNSGTIKIDVTYNNLKTDFYISVVKAKKIEVDKTTIKTEYKVGEKFDKNNMEIIVTNEDNSKTKVSGKDVEIVGTTDFNSPGEKEIVINYAGSSTKVKVNVTEDNQKDPNNNQNQNNNTNEEETNNEQEEEKQIIEYKQDNTYLIIGGIVVGLCLVLIISLIIKFKNRQKVDY